MSDHETPEAEHRELNALMPSKKVVRHLLLGCETCQGAVKQGLDSLVATRGKAEAADLGSAYDAVLDRAVDHLERTASLSEDEKRQFFKATSLLRSGDGVLAIAGAGRMSLEGLGVYEALLARSWAIRYDNPREMRHLAKVAAEMSEGFSPETYGGIQRVADLRARAWGEVANAYRVANRLREAQEAFGKAFGFLGQGSGDRGLKMRLLDLEASFLGTSREFALALQRLQTLSKMYWDDGEIHLAGRALITKALYMFYRGDTEEACQTMVEGLGLIDRDRDPSLAVVATFNYLLLLVDSNRFKDAKRALFENRMRFVTQGNVAGLKLRWIEGRISYGLSELGSAEIALREAKQGLIDAGMGFAAALAGLDLTMTLLRQGRREEAIQEGLESAVMFRDIGIHREFLGTAVMLEDAFRAKTVNLHMVEVSAQYMRKAMMEFGKG